MAKPAFTSLLCLEPGVEIFAPGGYQRHLDNIAAAYVRVLPRARKAGGIADYSDAELEVVVHILMGARSYLSRRYAFAGRAVRPVPEHVVAAYEKLLLHKLFRRTES